MARPNRARLRRDQRRPAQAYRSPRRLPIVGGDVQALALEGGAGLGTDSESVTPEVFGVAGVWSRPDGSPEAIVVAIGGDGHDCIVATRDHAWALASGAADMPPGEVWIANSKAFVRIRANGDIELGRPDGTFEKLATESHVHNAATGTTPLANGGGAVAGITGPAIASLAPATPGRGLAAKVKAETPGAP